MRCNPLQTSQLFISHPSFICLPPRFTKQTGGQRFITQPPPAWRFGFIKNASLPFRVYWLWAARLTSLPLHSTVPQLCSTSGPSLENPQNRFAIVVGREQRRWEERDGEGGEGGLMSRVWNCLQAHPLIRTSPRDTDTAHPNGNVGACTCFWLAAGI